MLQYWVRFFLLSFLVSAGFAQDIKLAWDANSEPDLAGYRVYYGAQAGVYGAPIDVGNTTTCTMKDLTSGTYYFAVTAYNSAGLESGYSNEVHALFNSETMPAPAVRAATWFARLWWKTESASSSTIEYGTTTGYGNSAAEPFPALSHSVLLPGLLPGAVYHYRIRSIDAYGNLTVSVDMTFTTPLRSDTETRQTLVFPVVPRSGVAMVNPNSTAAIITVREDGSINPNYWILDPGEQLTIPGAELFGTWMQLDSTNSGIVTFAAEASAGSPASSAVFTGQAEAINPGSTDATVRFDVLDNDGSLLISTVETISPQGKVSPDASDPNSSYIRAVSSAPLVFSGQDAGVGGYLLYAPLYMSGDFWRTTLSIFNLDPFAGTVTVRLIGDDGVQLDATRTLEIQGRGRIYITDRELFATDGSGTTQGYLEIRSVGPRLTGTMTLNGSAEFPLLPSFSNSLIVPYIASDPGYFTGLAILNPGVMPATASIEMYSPDGQLQATATEIIQPGQKSAKLLAEYFPGQSRGYVIVRSDRDVLVSALLGASDLSSLFAIPAQPAR